jgi:hypothetical protein
VKHFTSNNTNPSQKTLFDGGWSIEGGKIEIVFGFFKTEFQILRNMNANFKCAPTIFTTYYILHNFLIERDIGRDDKDKEPNSTIP